MIKERLKSKGVADITAKELEGYFSPWHAKHIGQIKVKQNNHVLVLLTFVSLHYC